MEKILQSDIEQYFEAVHFVPLNKKEAIRQILDRHPDTPKNSIYFVGNSRKDDMRPAIELGINGILIYEYTWHFDEAEFEGMDRVVELDNLAKLREFFEARK